MAKASGGTRNYSSNSATLIKRKGEYDKIMSTGDYTSGYFSKSGGYNVTHKGHNPVADANVNKEEFGAKVLADKGYRVYRMSERAYIEGVKKSDGFHEHAVVDMKTINSAGKYRIENVLKNAAIQGAEVAILIQNTKEMTRKYVEEQISSYLKHAKGEERGILKQVIAIGMSGHVHRHIL